MIDMARSEEGVRWTSTTEDLDLAARVLPTHLDSIPVMGFRFCTLVSSSDSLFTPKMSFNLLTNTTARALYMYQAAIPEELGFGKGDYLAVLRHQDDGWWEAEVHNGNGRVGLVPSNYLQPC